MNSEYETYVARFESEGIDAVCRAMNKQCELTTELQQKRMFGDWEDTVGAAEMAARAAIAAYKDILLRAFADLGSGTHDE